MTYSIRELNTRNAEFVVAESISIPRKDHDDFKLEPNDIIKIDAGNAKGLNVYVNHDQLLWIPIKQIYNIKVFDTE